ncbi:serine-rich adhesin for platelets-like [Ptychodera flava]|uniref:serine-rich adhesin for platelets-like n=1 Tax=Ptychodera flava TaxID=63121 RepID=UPI003969CC0D
MQHRDKVSALIVNEGWGSACSDGIPSINRMIASILSDIQIDNIYSTEVRYNEREEEEAERFRVLFKYPVPEERKLKQLLPNRSIPGTVYLYLHDHFYPNLRELSKDVKFVFGYSLSTAAEARKLKQDIFRDAELYLINVWNPDGTTFNPEIISCDDKELALRTQELSELHRGSHVLSVGKSAYRYFERPHRMSQSYEHYCIQPNLGGVSNSYKELEKDSTFEMISLLQPNDLNLKDLKSIVHELEYVTKTYCDKLRIEMKVIGNVSESEKEILTTLSNSAIRLFPKYCETQSELEDALLGCHLVLANTNAQITDPSVSLALSLGVPLLLPVSEDFEYMIEKYLKQYKHHLMVDINDKATLHEKLKEKIVSYHLAVSTAKEISDHISKERLTIDTCVEVRKELEKQLRRITRVGRPKQAVGGEYSPSGSTHSEEIESDGKSVAVAVAETTTDDGTKEGEDASVASRPIAVAETTTDDETKKGEDTLVASRLTVGSERSPSGSIHSEEIASDSKSVAVAVAETTTDDETKKREDALVAGRPTVGGERSPSGSTHSEEVESDSKSVAVAVAETTTDDGTKEGENASVAGRPIAGGESSPIVSIDPEQMTYASITAELRVASGIPEPGGTMSMVSHSLYNTSAEMLSAEHKNTIQVLKDNDPDIEVSDPEEGSIRYNIKCKTSKALQGLWQRYQSGKLRESVEKVLITPDVLSKVHAVCITMRVIIDYNEYEEALHILTSRENISGNDISTETDVAVSEKKEKELEQKNITDCSKKTRQELLQEDSKEDLGFEMENLSAQLEISENQDEQLVMKQVQKKETEMEKMRARLESSKAENVRLVMEHALQNESKMDMSIEMDNLRARIEQLEKRDRECDNLKSMLTSIEESGTIVVPGRKTADSTIRAE